MPRQKESFRPQITPTDEQFQGPPAEPLEHRRVWWSISVEFLLRLVGAVAAGIGGYFGGSYLGGGAENPQSIVYGIAVASLCAGLGLLLTPYVTTRPLGWLRRRVQQAPAHELIAALIGLFIGLIFSALLAIPLSSLPSPLKESATFLAMIVFAYLGVTLTVLRKKDLLALFGGWRTSGERHELRDKGGQARPAGQKIILDTSAIIDGRIADVSQTGFISGPMIVPRFVLSELQHIADSPDTLRRNRGRRGLEILGRLQKESLVPIELADVEANGADVDAKLVKMAKQLGCAILTNDYNLNRVAALQGVRVLNINELANALKSVVLPGEEIAVRVIQEGKEFGQGVGYLDDGTMVVVESGRRYQGSEITVVVTRVLQTVAGRMIFAHPKD